MDLELLVVDDDEVSILIHTTLIKKSKLGNPLSFSNGKEIIEYLLKKVTTDNKFLVFLDINMPQMSAWEFMEITKEFQEQIFVIIVTSSINKSDQEKAQGYKNIISFIVKPMKKEDCEKIKSIPEISGYF